MSNDEEGTKNDLEAPLLENQQQQEQEASPAEEAPLEVEQEEEPAALEAPPSVEDGSPENDAEEEDALVVDSSTEDVFQGEFQSPAYRDVWFAVLFYIFFFLMLGTAAWYGRFIFEDYDNDHHDDSHDTNNETMTTTATTTTMLQMLGNNTVAPASDDDDGNSGISRALVLLILKWTTGILTLCLLAAMISCMLLLFILDRYSKTAVQISFAVAPISMALVALVMTFVGSGDDDAMASSLSFWGAAILSSAIAAIHYLCCRRYIAYTAANLQVALRALRSNRGLWGVASAAQIVLVLYNLVAAVAIGGLTAYKKSVYHTELETWVYVAWLVVVFWTVSVIQNVLRTSTAGAVGAWWFGNTAGETKDSVRRALTYSFGSICLGSLLLAIVQVLERLVHWSRQNRRGRQHDNLFLCVMDCLLHLLSRLVDYFNSWAFLYVGLYGYKYTEAGYNVMTLFRQRGWSFVLTDRLLYQTLQYAQMAVGMLSGGIVAAVSVLSGQVHNTGGIMALFGAGVLAGLVLASIAFLVVESAVRTIVLCFCERPAEGALQHAGEVACLSQGWGQTYADEWQVSAQQEADEEEEAAALVPPP